MSAREGLLTDTLFESPAAKVDHPARFTDVILQEIAGHLKTGWRVLDPFAGTGRIHKLAMIGIDTVGVEIEPEWADMHPRTIVGDALAIPFADGSFDAIATSPTYGNRMADHHNARDDTRRITYRHVLGRPLHKNNSGQLQWGEKYREFHRRAWGEALRVLRPGGLFILNVSDHIRRGQRQDVTVWHFQALRGLGCRLETQRLVETPRMGFGANAEKRVPHEVVAVFKKAKCRLCWGRYDEQGICNGCT